MKQINVPLLVPQVALSLATPHIPTRKVILEILTYFAANNEGEFQPLVVSALEALSATQNESGCYQYWFRALETTLAGRGKMGSLVGASDEVKKSGAVEASLNEYAVRPYCTEEGIAYSLRLIQAL